MATVMKYCSNYACTLFAPNAVLATKGFYAVTVSQGHTSRSEWAITSNLFEI